MKIIKLLVQIDFDDNTRWKIGEDSLAELIKIKTEQLCSSYSQGQFEPVVTTMREDTKEAETTT